MFGKKETFRRAALERLSSPERLDEMMRAIPPKGWVAITTVVGLAALALLWGFFGSIPDRVEGQGLLIPGETKAVMAPSAGVVTSIRVKVGDMVEPGFLVAVLTDPNAANEIESLERELKNLKADGKNADREDEVEEAQTDNDLRAKQGKAEAEIMVNTKKRDQALEQLAKMEKRPDVYGKSDMDKWRTQRDAALTALSSLGNDLASYKKQREEATQSRLTRRNDRQQKLLAKESEIELRRLDQGTRLEARDIGRVFDVMVTEGATVSPTDQIVRVEQSDQEVQAVVYVPAREGQNVRIGQEVQIAPSNVKKEEYGTIRAQVIDKQDYPSDKQAIISTIRNETLAEEYTKSGAPLYVRIALDPLANTEQVLAENPALSGYQWTSGKGPERKIFSGTPCQATVITGYSRPIDKAISWLKTTSGL